MQQWVEDCIEDTAQKLDIPHHSLDYKQYTEPARQKEVLKIWFRSDGQGQQPGNKYGFEVVHNGDNVQQSIVKDQIERSLRKAEEVYHDDEDNVTFYKNHSFFWRVPPAEDLEWSIEVQCTVCEHTERVTGDVDDIQYRHDLYLIYLIKKCHECCECPNRRWQEDDEMMNEAVLENSDLAVEEGKRFPRV